MNERQSAVGTAIFMVGIVVVLAGLAYYLVMSVPGPDAISQTPAGTASQADQGNISALYPDTGGISSTGAPDTSAASGQATSTGTSTP